MACRTDRGQRSACQRSATFGFTLGDVAGKGPPAALLTAMIQGAFAAQVPSTESPAALIAHINRTLIRRAYYALIGLPPTADEVEAFLADRAPGAFPRLVDRLLAHPGGPFWQKKDLGAWSIPKGEFAPGEEPLAAAQREFHEETGFQPTGPFVPLESLKQPSGKVVHAWAVEGDFDPTQLRSNTFAVEWPRGSGRVREYPEIDRAAWLSLAAARDKILPGQRGFLDQLSQILGSEAGRSGA